MSLRPRNSVFIGIAGLQLLALASCKRSQPEPPSAPVLAESGVAAEPDQTAPKVGVPIPQPRSTTPPPTEIWKEFSGDNAFDEVRKQVGVGPRPSGSAELESARKLITTALAAHGWDVELQPFTDETPRGPVKFVNVIARFSATTARPAPTNTQRTIVCSHYDTKRFSTIQFVGASDGASSTGALLELARVLALDPALAAKVELVFFDGEEAFVQFDEKDGLYGSRFYARALHESHRAGQFKFGILWDMIGDKDLTITLSPDSPQPLTKQLLATADALGLRSYFGYHSLPIYDDHIPLIQAKIPTVDIIDFDYLPWHSADDKLDKLSPESLQKIGAVTLRFLYDTLGK